MLLFDPKHPVIPCETEGEILLHPNLRLFPLPPAGKTGWPWIEQSSEVDSGFSDISVWPKISIITPSLNQAQFLEETLRSVLLQGYPNLEYIVIDGGSTDGSCEIIRKYSPWLAYWVSEKDKGQSDAINKGFARATGDIIAWINSDDLYLPGALVFMGQAFQAHSEIDMIFGSISYVDEDTQILRKWNWQPYTFPSLITRKMIIPQQGAFWRRRVYEDVGGLCDDIHYALDTEYWFRIGCQHSILGIEKEIAYFRLSSSHKGKMIIRRVGGEHLRILDTLYAMPHLPADVLKVKRRAYGMAYDEGGRGFLATYNSFHNSDDFYQARSWFIKALSADPSLVFYAPWRKNLLRTLFGLGFYQWGLVLKANLRKVFSKNKQHLEGGPSGG